MNKKTVTYAGFSAALLVLLGCVSVDAVGEVEQAVQTKQASLSRGATDEITKLARASKVGQPRIVVAIDAEGNVVVLAPNGVELEPFRPERLRASYRFKPPILHGTISTSPGDAFYCPEVSSGGYDICVKPRRP